MSSGRQDQRPELVGIIGFPVGHSVSPAFQQAALGHLGINARYERWETPPEHLAPRILGLRRPGILGANVTVPHKQNVISLLDDIDEAAERIGAVNTVVNRGGRLSGYNTDAPGFLRALKEDGGLSPQGKRALILGAGGAARAVTFALLGDGAAAIVITNRTASRAEALAETLQSVGQTSGLSSKVSTTAWGSTLVGGDLIVNATTIGMRGGDDEGRSPLDGVAIPSDALVCDLVYNPSETPLLRDARLAGARVLGGLPMLVYQGTIAFEMWTGRQAPAGVMLKAAGEAL